MKRTLTAVAVLLTVIGLKTSYAQFGGSGTASKIQLETKLSVDKAAPGSTIKAAVVMTIAEGWHTNSHTPSEENLIGTALELKPVEGVILSDLQYPHGEDLKFAFSETPLNVYEGTVPIFLSLKLSDKVEPSEVTLAGTLTVQACDNNVCLAPSKIPILLTLPIASAQEAPISLNDELFATYIPAQTSSSTVAVQDPITQVLDQEGAAVAFLAIFLVGLALNLTPCVYPMLSVTVSLFGAQTDTNIVRVFFKALVYVLGMATMYSLLGVSAALSGGLFGSWLQSPWVLAGIAALLFGLALSMFGLYQIQMPFWLTSKLGGTTGTGLIGLYLSGLVVGIFAAPCVGPPVIALLAFVGGKGDPVFGFWTFFTLSLGLGFPYLILGTFSGLLKKVPRSGVWLIWVERTFGVVLSGAALFYLSLAFFPKFSAFIILLVVLLGGIYLGFLEPSGKDKKGFLGFKRAFGVLAIAFSIYGFNTLREPGITWELYSPEKLAAAQTQSKPVMLDFYADWCIPCLELDRKTFTDSDVISATENFVRLKVDLTHFDSPESEELRQQFSIAGVPTIVFLDGSGNEVRSSRVVGYLPPERFITKLQPLISER
ncbi:MAG: thioredoxin family protein [Ignavibacteriae bacterium]|nr:thioredoxin family protein [Ignavibacteriota bacterium]